MVYVTLPLDARDTLEKKYVSYCPGYEHVMERLVQTIRRGAADLGLFVTVRHRVKQFSSWYAKVLRNAALSNNSEKPGLSITDILGIRIVCPFLEEVELVSDMLRDLFRVDEFERKGADYPVHHFGYESVHFLVRIPDNFLMGNTFSSCFSANPVCEVQVRTILQEAWAEVEHELVYKSDFSPLDEPLKRKLAALNANLTLSDIMFQEIRDYQKELHTALKQRRTDFYTRLRRETAESRLSEETLSDTSPRDTVDGLLLKGLLAHNDGRYTDAIRIYTGILERDIRKDIRSVILTHRGMAYFSGGLSDSALEDFNQALNLDPAYTKARYYRAVHARTEGRFQDAFGDLDECLRLDPYNSEYLTARAETHAAAGNMKAATEDCRAVLRIEPLFKPALRLIEELEGP